MITYRLSWHFPDHMVERWRLKSFRNLFWIKQKQQQIFVFDCMFALFWGHKNFRAPTVNIVIYFMKKVGALAKPGRCCHRFSEPIALEHGFSPLSYWLHHWENATRLVFQKVFYKAKQFVHRRQTFWVLVVTKVRSKFVCMCLIWAFQLANRLCHSVGLYVRGADLLRLLWWHHE